MAKKRITDLGELTLVEAQDKLLVVDASDTSGSTEGTTKQAEVGKLPFATLDVNNKILVSQLPEAILGALTYQGVWNAATNTPAIPAASAENKGWYRKVSVAGSTNVDGITDWKVGDWIVSSGSVWDKVDNTDQVTSVNGKQGTVKVYATDIDMSASDTNSVWSGINSKIPRNQGIELGGGKAAIEANGDWDDYRTTGMYRGNNLLNRPSGNGHPWDYVIVVFGSGGAYGMQIAVNYNGVYYCYRTRVNDIWQPWHYLMDERDLATINNELSGKADSSHSHAMGDISGLANALAGKAASIHSHTGDDIEVRDDTGATVLLQAALDDIYLRLQSLEP